MDISSRFSVLASKFNQLVPLRTQKRSFITSFGHVYNNRSNANTRLLKPCESQLNGVVSKLRYGISHSKPPKDLSTDAITKIIAKNESYADIGEKTVAFIETSQLPANDPVEDMHAEGRLLTNDGFLFGVFDGHGGETCSHYVSECLFPYMANYLAKNDDVRRLIFELKVDNRQLFYGGSIKWFSSPPNKVVHEANDYFTENIRRITSECLKTKKIDISQFIKTAFVQLDRDITNGPLITTLNSKLRSYLMKTASSGSCATVAYVNDCELYVANTGDCRAVIGATNDSGEIIAIEITRDHNYKNAEEVKRLNAFRPKERYTVLKNDRLLGIRRSLRSFGDVQFKWSLDDLKHMFPNVPERIPSNYLSPPYLIADPEVFHYWLTKNDKFLVLATGGLWDVISSSHAVKLIDQHIKQFKDSSRNIAGTSLSDDDKKDCSIFCDRNCATFLIRNALGLFNEIVSSQLTLPAEAVSRCRDDITVTIVYFDTKYIKS